MGFPSAVVLSKDAELVEFLSAKLNKECAIQAGPYGQPASGMTPSAQAQPGPGAANGQSIGHHSRGVLFADLRRLERHSAKSRDANSGGAAGIPAGSQAEFWDDLKRIAASFRRVVGIVDRGLPVEYIAEAVQVCQAFVKPPFEQGQLQRAMVEAERAGEFRHLQQPRQLSGGRHHFVTFTPSLFPSLDELRIAARHDFTILLIGETGTGKSYLANLIHELSPRAERRFVPVACGALPKDLLDSELFGHKKGAFTGAEMDKEGKLEAAGDGTFLLDEIDVLGTEQQVKLLRILETGEYERVGCNETRKLKARTVVASNLSLEQLIAEGRFRSDLYFRLKQVKFEIPPLRQRPMDIVPLAVKFIAECSREHEIPVSLVSPEFIRVLMAYQWPGNIRELRNETRRAVLFCQDGVIEPALLTPAVVHDARKQIEQQGAATASNACLAREVAQTEQEAIESMLKTHNFNRAATARALGISRVTLYNKIRKYHITLDRRKPK